MNHEEDIERCKAVCNAVMHTTTLGRANPRFHSESRNACLPATFTVAALALDPMTSTAYLCVSRRPLCRCTFHEFEFEPGAINGWKSRYERLGDIVAGA